MRLGTTFTEIADGPDGARVTLSDGGKATYDLVVGADGLYSKMRKTFFPDAPAPRYTGHASGERFSSGHRKSTR